MNEQELEELAEREAALARDEADREATAKSAARKGWPVQTVDGVVMATRNLLIGNQRVIRTAGGDQYVWSHERQGWVPQEPGPPPAAVVEGQESLPEPAPKRAPRKKTTTTKEQ